MQLQGKERGYWHFLCIAIVASGVVFCGHASPEKKDETCEIVQFDALVEQNFSWGAYHALVFARTGWLATSTPFPSCGLNPMATITS